MLNKIQDVAGRSTNPWIPKLDLKIKALASKNFWSNQETVTFIYGECAGLLKRKRH